MSSHILTLNAGSSSIKFALFEREALRRVVTGKVDRIGTPQATLQLTNLVNGQKEEHAFSAAGVSELARFLEGHVGFDSIAAVGHRIVHGGARYHDPQAITPELIAFLEEISRYDPEHLPAEIAMIRVLAQDYPALLQVACFDTAFHHDMPSVAKILSIPRRYFNEGVQRYGFHGLSYAYLMGELQRVASKEAAQGRVILAHLGNGASMCAVREGRSIDTTMAFSPTAGLVMSARSGDLDPGLFVYLARKENMTADRLYQMANFESGLLGVSETSSDMRDLLAREKDDTRAADAIALFCYTVRKTIGAYAAALGGLETLVFAGGIGENAAVIRARICEGLDFLGIGLDVARNEANAPLISTDTARVSVRVIKTDEELQIAQSVKGTGRTT